jgi:hypothetical protein
MDEYRRLCVASADEPHNRDLRERKRQFRDDIRLNFPRSFRDAFKSDRKGAAWSNKQLGPFTAVLDKLGYSDRDISGSDSEVSG